METRELILKAFERTSAALTSVVRDLRPDEMKWRPGPQANPIGFILWHVTRTEDRFVNARIRQKPQVWDDEKWRKLLDFTGNPADTGNGYTPEQVAAFQVPRLEDLLQYNQAVRASTTEFLKGVTSQTLDSSMEFPGRGLVTVTELLILFLAEVNQHIGQIDYVRGLVQSLRK